MGRSLVALLVAALGAAQPLTPEIILLGRTRYHMVETLRRIPNYTCLETIERSVRAPKSRRATLVDALRLEVAVVDGKELFSWPGERQFKERDLRELAPGGAIGNGNFALHAKSVFGGNAVRFILAPPASAAAWKVLRRVAAARHADCDRSVSTPMDADATPRAGSRSTTSR